ncbi:hypothetical protein HPB50_019235 [Hyalomma asiaticum]|uniref:Uncharacterized protein n=1 Tax=Hyalomma asiaticum TaxID=266040 RepID=A0ACB7S3T5_HYAAI|nr:hypothetical protein HPB50_019235 [Hyalomma asiaticum]
MKGDVSGRRRQKRDASGAKAEWGSKQLHASCSWSNWCLAEEGLVDFPRLEQERTSIWEGTGTAICGEAGDASIYEGPQTQSQRAELNYAEAVRRPPPINAYEGPQMQGQRVERNYTEAVRPADP